VSSQLGAAVFKIDGLSFSKLGNNSDDIDGFHWHDFLYIIDVAEIEGLVADGTIIGHFAD
jgi:hypothetical protein